MVWLKRLLVGIVLMLPVCAFALPSSVDRITDHIEPLIKSDWVRGIYFQATSTTATSTFPVASSTKFCLGIDCRTAWPTGGGSDPFTHPAAGVSATTSSLLVNNATSTINNLDMVNSTSTNATSTTLSTALASTTNLIISSITSGHVPFATTAGKLTQDLNLFFYDSASHFLGLGTAIPTARLHVTNSGAHTPNAAANEAIFENSIDDAGFTIFSKNDKSNIIAFSDTDNTIDGSVEYNHGTDVLRVKTNGSTIFSVLAGEMMNLVSNGNVGIGTDTPMAKLSVVGASGVVAAKYTATGTPPSVFPYATTTALSASELCLTGDVCRNTWPTGGGSDPFTHPAAGVSATTSSLLVNAGTSTITNLRMVNASSTDATTTNLSITNVGQGWLYTMGDAYVKASTTPTVNYVVATATTASRLPYASSTGLSVSGALYGGSSNQFTVDAFGQTTAASLNLTGSNPVTNGFNLITASAIGIYNNAAQSGVFSSAGFLGLGSTSPWARLSVTASAGAVALAVGSSSSPTLFGVDSTGRVGVGTSTPNWQFSVNGQSWVTSTSTASTFVATSTTATSTFANGLNLTGGCFSINGVCFTGGAAGSLTGTGVLNAWAYWTSATNLDASSSPTVNYLVATSSTASRLPYATSTAISATEASSTFARFGSLVLLNASGTVISTTEASSTFGRIGALTFFTATGTVISTTEASSTFMRSGFDITLYGSSTAQSTTNASSTFFNNYRSTIINASTSALTISGVASTSVLRIDTLADGCLNITTGLVGSAACSAGGGANSKWATSTNPDNSVFLNGPGNVGIGTSSPHWKLQVASSTFSQFTLSTGVATDLHWSLRNFGGWFALATSSATTFATSTVNAFTIDNNSNFGIATNTPGTRLSVQGDALISGNLTATNATTTGTFTTTNFVGTNSTTTTLGIGSFAGTLFATAGVVQATSTLAINNGGTGVQSFGQGWIFSSGVGALAASTSPTINYLVATSTTANNTFANNVGIGTTSPWCLLCVHATGTKAPFAIGSSSAQLFLIESTGSTTINNVYGGNLFTLNAGSTTGPIFAVQATSSDNFFFSINQYGHLMASSTKIVTLSSCGTSPTLSIGSNDNYGTITPGATAGGCTVTFGTAYTNTPTCMVTEQTLSLVNALTYTVSATALTISQTALTSKLDFHCFGQ